MFFLACCGCVVKDKETQYEIGQYYENEAKEIRRQGWAFESDESAKKASKVFKKSLKYYEKAAKQGHTDAMYRYAHVIYHNSCKQLQSYKFNAKSYLSKAANDGHFEAIKELDKLNKEGDFTGYEIVSKIDSRLAAERRKKEEEKREYKREYDINHPEEALLTSLLDEQKKQTYLMEQSNIMKSLGY